MKRDTRLLSSQEFDLVVVGGGVYGAFIAWDAALRGFRVALLEKEDFGGATSANCLKIVHGGLRYLQTLDIARMRQSIRERRNLLRMAPHLVRPLRCVMPAYGHGTKGREVLAAAVNLSDLIGFDRNKGLGSGQSIPNSRSLSRENILEELPGLATEGCTGGIEWTEGFMHSPERLVLAVVKSAVQAGAVAINYVKASELLTNNGAVAGVKAVDGFSKETHEVRGKMVINASGPWLPELSGIKVVFTKAFNLVLNRRIVEGKAAGVFHPGGQVLFMVPWRGLTVLGTAHRPFEGTSSDRVMVTEAEIDQFLKSFNQAYPGEPVVRQDVLYVNAGLLPGEKGAMNQGEARLLKHFRIIDHGDRDGLPGLISVIGVKYTTARDVAERVVDYVDGKFGHRAPAGGTSDKQVEGGQMRDFDEFLNQQLSRFGKKWGEGRVRHLAAQYGTEMSFVEALMDQNPEWSQPLDESLVTGAEIIYAVREEMAMTVADVLRRRTAAGGWGVPADSAVRRCSEIISREIGQEAVLQ